MDPSELQWYYVDRTGKEFGPFGNEKMRGWFASGLFELIGNRLLVRLEQWEDMVAISELFPDGHAPFAGPPLMDRYHRPRASAGHSHAPPQQEWHDASRPRPSQAPPPVGHHLAGPPLGHHPVRPHDALALLPPPGAHPPAQAGYYPPPAYGYHPPPGHGPPPAYAYPPPGYGAPGYGAPPPSYGSPPAYAPHPGYGYLPLAPPPPFYPGPPPGAPIHDGGRYVGRVKSFSEKNRYGFIDCPAAYARWHRDVFIHTKWMAGVDIGDEISFFVEVNEDGRPQSRDILRLEPRGEDCRYKGCIKSFNAERGFGFVECPGTFARFGRDVFVHKQHLEGLDIDSVVTFTVFLNKDGHPQARDVEPADGRPREANGGGRKRRGKGDGAGQPPKRVKTEALPALTMPEAERTTLMVRNLPGTCTRDGFIETLNGLGFENQFDFVYLPTSFKHQKSCGYAFVNFSSPEVTQKAFGALNGYNGLQTAEHSLAVEVCWSATQGFDIHIERYRNSPIMHPEVLDKFRPLVLRDGVALPFPAPTKPIKKPPRLRKDLVKGKEGLAGAPDGATDAVLEGGAGIGEEDAAVDAALKEDADAEEDEDDAVDFAAPNEGADLEGEVQAAEKVVSAEVVAREKVASEAV